MATLLACLAGCGGAEQAASCVLQPVVAAKLELSHGLPAVRATVAGEPVRLLVDTGAVHSLLSPATAQRLRLRRDRWVGERVIGVGGVSFAWNAVTGSVTIGGVALSEPEMPVVPLAVPADGLLGGDFWRRFDADLDLPDRRLTLYRPTGCHREVAPWGGPAVLIEGLPDSPPQRLMVPATLAAIPAAALFDTGSQTSAVALRLAARLPPPPGGWHVVHVRGVNTAGRAVPARQFARLRLGDLVLTDRILPVLPFPPGRIDMLVGEDVLRGCRTWFSFAAKQVFIAATEGNVLPCAASAADGPAG